MIPRDDIIRAGEQVYQLILLFGGSPSTAFKCAGLFCEGLEYENRRRAEVAAFGAILVLGTGTIPDIQETSGGDAQAMD